MVKTIVAVLATPTSPATCYHWNHHFSLTMNGFEPRSVDAAASAGLSSWKSSGLVLEQRAGTNMWNQKQKYCLSKGKKWNTSPSLSSIGHQQIHLLLICIELNFVQRLLPCWPSWRKIVKSSHLKAINFRVASCHSWSECRRRFLEMFQKHFKNRGLITWNQKTQIMSHNDENSTKVKLCSVLSRHLPSPQCVSSSFLAPWCWKISSFLWK